jgi:hypothetical protein
MFEAKSKTESTPAAVKSASAPVTPGAVALPEIVIHTYPKEFYNRDVGFKEEPQIAKPTLAAAPVPHAVAPAMAKPVIAKAPVPPAKPKPKTGAILGVIVTLILIGGAGLAIAYSLGVFEKAQPEPVPTVPEPQPTVPEPEPAKPTPEPLKAINGVDTDSDGLTNVEELLYGTDFRSPDSDGDTYLDGNEVFHRFDPRGLAPSTLLDTGSVRILQSVDLPFTLYYPITWNPVSAPTTRRVTFRSATSAEVVVIWEAKDPQLTLTDWYSDKVNAVNIERLQPTITKEGYQVLIAPDERIMYVLAGNQVYTFTYTLGDMNSVEFLQTFKMMANSFKLTSP